MTTFTADTPREWREKTGSLSKKLNAEFGLLETLLDGVNRAATSYTITKATITLAGATKINLDGPVDISGAVVCDTATAKGISLTAACTIAQIYIGGTALLASGEQAIYVNCVAETVATNGIWVTLKSTVTSGDLTGARIKAHTLRETSGGPNVRGVYAQAMSDTSDKFAAMLQGGLFVAGYTGANTTATSIYGVTGFISQGEGLLACTTLAAVQAHLQTRGDETITTHTGVLITNEAVGGNGRTMNSAIRITETNMGGGTKSFDVLIDATGVNTTIHDTDQTDLIKFRDSGGTERKIVFDPTNNTVLEVQTA